MWCLKAVTSTLATIDGIRIPACSMDHVEMASMGASVGVFVTGRTPHVTGRTARHRGGRYPAPVPVTPPQFTRNTEPQPWLNSFASQPSLSVKTVGQPFSLISIVSDIITEHVNKQPIGND